MKTRVNVFLLAAAVSGLALATAAGAASPTPALKTGDYAGQWALLATRDPTQYSRPFVAGLHPTTIHYDAVSQTYTLSDGATLYGFSPREIVAAKTTAAYTFYRDTSTGSTLQLLNQGAANPVIALTYVTYGKWVIPPSAPIKLNHNYVVFGAITPPAGMPRTGSASYRAVLDGTYANLGGTYSLAGSAAFTANFGAGNLSFTATPVGTNITNGSKLNFGTITGGGYISFADSSFIASHPYDGRTRLSTNGYFFGPHADEIGGAFTITSTIGGSSGAGAGAYVGKRN